MVQVSKYPISNKVYERILEVFLKILTKIESKGEANQFIKDFLTPTEQIMLSKRLAIAFLLEKDYDYQTIRRILRVSGATIARVNLMRKYGGQGYERMIRKLLREEKVKDFLFKVGEVLSGIPVKGAKGGSEWRYLHHELKKKRRKRKKPF